MTNPLPIVERLRRFFAPTIVLHHGKYPMSSVQRPKYERCLSVGEAKRRVREIYRDQWGWWFQITRNGKEVWSSDAEIATLNAVRGQ